MRLRDVTRADVDLYVRLRCDPVVMAELGGPLPREGIEAKVERDVAAVERGESLLSVVETEQGESAGLLGIWTQDDHSEMFWLIAPEFQRRGLAKAAGRALLERARAEGRWGAVHAYTAVTNARSNAICRALGMVLDAESPVDITFEGRTLVCNHWHTRR
jgi:RimJ/RimL family protein N-acetyltransferase